MRSLFLSLLIFFSFIVTSYAQDAGLYEPPPSPDASFVRLMNVGGDASGLKINGKSYETATIGQSTPYFVISKGSNIIEIDDKTLKSTLNVQQFYTAIRTKDDLLLLNDKVGLNKTKALLTLYNFGSGVPVTLKTSDGKVVITDAADFGKSASREINAVKVGLGVYQGVQKLADAGERSLSRGAAYSITLYKNEAGQMQVSFVQAQIKAAK